MKRPISLGLLVLALGSCQSVDAPTQVTPSDRMGVMARLDARAALPSAERFRARLVVGSQPGTWTDTVYAKGTVVRLGQVPRGSALTLDVRGYSATGTDTVWKWFAHKVDTAKGDLDWIVLEAQVDTLPVAASISPIGGQSLTLPVGTWYTTDSTTSWKSLKPQVVDASGKIVPQAGTTLRVRLRVAVPGTTDTLLGDTLRATLPPVAVVVGPPVFVPASGTVEPGSTIRLDTAKFGDLIQFRTQGTLPWNTYSGPIPAASVTLEARSLRGSDASAIVSATFLLAASIDSFVAPPKFAPASGSVLSASDSIRFDSIPAGDTVEIRRNKETDWVVARALAATTDSIHARSRREEFLSEEVVAVYTINASQPKMPSLALIGTCPTDGCDPGTKVRIANDSGTLEYATDSIVTSASWKTWISGDQLALSRSTTVLARTTRSGVSSATARLTVSIVQPGFVSIDTVTRTSDSVRVRLNAASGTIKFRLASQTSIQQAASKDIVTLAVGDTLTTWTVRGTATAPEVRFVAVAVKPTRPQIVPTTASGRLAPDEVIRLVPAEVGDSLQYRIGTGSTWIGYAGTLRAGTGDSLKLAVRALRHGIASDEVDTVLLVDVSRLAPPSLSPVCDPSCTPGASVTLKAGFGLFLEHGALADSSSWSRTSDSLVTFVVMHDTTVYARAASATKTSSISTFVLHVRQPDTVTFQESIRYADSVRIRIAAMAGDSILYARNASSSFTNSGSTDSFYVTVPVRDSLQVRTKRGTALGRIVVYRAQAIKPGRPGIVPTTASGPLAPDELVKIVPAQVGDDLEYRLGSSSAWIPYTGTLRSGTAGTFKVTARALRNGLVSDDTSATFTVDTAKLAPPTLSSTCTPSCDPGTVLTLNAGFGAVLAHGALADSNSWSKITDSLVTFTVTHDTTINARSLSTKKSSPIASFVLHIQQPDTVKIVEATRYLDSVRIRIVASAGDTIQYARNGSATFTSTGKTDTASLVVPILDSMSVRTRRGTAYGPVSGYVAQPATPPLPLVTPAAGHIRDTTSIFLSSVPGSAISYRLGTSGTWSAYIAPFHLAVGTTVLHKRNIRYSLVAEDSATFVVHARPAVVTFTGCTTACGPGTKLTLTGPAGTTIHYSTDSSVALPWSTYSGAFSFDATTTIWAYADSAGYRSKLSGTTVQVVSSGAPTFSAFRTKRPNASTATDTAFVSIRSVQDGDTLHHQVGTGPVRTILVSGSVTIVDTLVGNQTVQAWSSRGNSVSDTIAFTLKPLPAPVEQTAVGTYNRGKSVSFATASSASGSQAGDIVLLSLTPNTWSRATSVVLNALGKDTVYARTLRMQFDGEYSDSSSIRKIVYTIDTVMLTALSTTPGTFTATFNPALLSYVDSVDAGVSSLDVNYTARTSSEVQSVTFNSTTNPTIALTSAPQQNVSVVVTNVYGTTSTYSILVCKRASDSALAGLSTSPGTLVGTFSPSTTTYVDSVPHDASSVVVTAIARTPSNVASITYNAGASNTIALNALGVTTITVDVTNKNGRHMVYTLQVYKKSFPYGSMIYGGKTYKTTVIGTQTWMAENLNYGGAANDTGVCQGTGTTPGPESACTQYGRLYTWYEAAAGNTGSSNVPSGLKGVCPTGWHLPSNGEWTTLVSYVESDPRVGVDKGSVALRSKTSWVYLAGTDLFGFSATLSGSRAGGGTFNNPSQPDFWASDATPTSGSDWVFYNETIGKSAFYKEVSLPVRCVKD